MLINIVGNLYCLRLFGRNKYRAGLPVYRSSFGNKSVIDFTAGIKSGLSGFCVVSIRNSCRNCFAFKFCKVKKIISHHSSFFGCGIEWLGEWVNTYTQVVKFVCNVKILSHISAEAVILFHDNAVDPSIFCIGHHLHKCRTMDCIFTAFAIVAVDAIVFIPRFYARKI